MSVYIFSTASNHCDFTVWGNLVGPDEKGVNNASRIAIPDRAIRIKGGANVIDRKTLQTPMGAVTEVSDEDYEILLKDPLFNQRVKDGYYKVEKRNKEPAKVLKEMKDEDGSAQFTRSKLDKKSKEMRELATIKQGGSTGEPEMVPVIQ